MDMCFTCCPIELAALSCMLDRGNGMDADRVVRHERTEEDWRKTKAAVCTETRRAKDEYDVLYGKPTPVLEFLELEFNGNTNTDRPALRSSVDSGVALNARLFKG